MQLITEKSKDYELIDSGDGEKLERYGEYVLRRPDPQAIWKKTFLPGVWDDVVAKYQRSGTSGKWIKTKEVKEPWEIILEGLTFSLSLLPSKHLGVFPEQVSGWKWLNETIKKESETRKKISVLNLFGYTGGASLASAKAGAEVVHLDASVYAVDRAKKNLELSGLNDKKVRFIVDDVRKFVEREIKRENKYDIILLDPPVYGKGSKGESWKIEEDLVPLVLKLNKLLTKNPIAVVLNGYASNYSSSTYGNVLEVIKENFGGKISTGELGIKEARGDRVLTAGIFARLEF